MAFTTVTVLSTGPVMAGLTTGTIRQFQLQATQTAAGPSPVGPLLDVALGVGMQGTVIALDSGNNVAAPAFVSGGNGVIPVLNGAAQTVSYQNTVTGAIITNPAAPITAGAFTVLIRC